MDKKAQFDLMEKIVRELDDLQNSQTAVLKKISQIEADNINLNNKTLENSLSELFSSIDTSLESVSKLHDTFREETDKFKTDHKLDQLPDLE